MNSKTVRNPLESKLIRCAECVVKMMVGLDSDSNSFAARQEIPWSVAKFCRLRTLLFCVTTSKTSTKNRVEHLVNFWTCVCMTLCALSCCQDTDNLSSHLSLTPTHLPRDSFNCYSPQHLIHFCLQRPTKSTASCWPCI
jgi:hypothetical protein